MPGTQELGFHGKLPTHGDFLRRRVGGEFLSVWDPWLQGCIHASRQRLGEAWLEAYLTSPMWRFLLSPGVCGQAPCTGLMMPSVDAVGRYFPLTLVRPLPEGTQLLDLPVEHGEWFDTLENLALGALDAEDGARVDAFDQAVLEHGSRLTPRLGASTIPAPGQESLHLGLQDLRDTGSALRLAQQAQLAATGDFSIWWTHGSRRIDPCLILHYGLPSAEGFGALLDGEWDRHGWNSRAMLWQPEDLAPQATHAQCPLRLASAALTDKGKVRGLNEDAYVDRPDLGLWAVADGVGGLAAGDAASQSVAQALQEVPAAGDLQDRLNHARQRLVSVNEMLIRASRDSRQPTRSASTAVVLIAGLTECCWLWAGDSRLYRWRDGQLETLTRDHSVVQELLNKGHLRPAEVPGHPQSNVITRAVGAAEALEPETRFAELRAGDRFLLCSDGVHGAISEETLLRALGNPTPQECAQALLDAVLEGEARDNATAVVVFVT